MRKGNLKQLEDDIAEVMDEKDMAEQARELMVLRFGRECASWLIGANWKKIHRMGGINFDMPTKAETPMWFALAMEWIKRRKGWSLAISRGRLKTVYRLRWTARQPHLALVN